MQATRGNLLKSTFIITIFTVLTGIINYLTMAFLAFHFGAHTKMDAYFAAMTLPQIILAIIGSIVPNSFIPVFIESRTKDPKAAWQIASTSLNVLFFMLSLAVVLGIAFSKNLIPLFNPGFEKQKMELAISLFRIFLPAIVFSGLSIVLNCIYYSHHKFFLPSLAQGSVALITLLFVFSTNKFFGIHSIALGNLAGVLGQFFMLLPIIMKKGRYFFMLNVKRKEVLRLGKVMFPLLIGAIFYRSNPLVERFFASRLGEGSISYLGFANKILMSLLLIISPGISTAIFPKMSEYAAKKDLSGLKSIISKGMRALIVVSVPAVFFLVLMRFDVVRLFFQRGSFTARDTVAVGNALLAYLGFFLVGILSVPIVNTLYSLQETLKVALVGIGGFLFYVLLSFFLANYFSYVGIALAISIQYMISFSIFLFLVIRRIGGFDKKAVRDSIFKTIMASLMASFFLLLSNHFLKLLVPFPIGLVVNSIVGIVVYLVTLTLLKSDELRYLRLSLFGRKKNRVLT